VTAGGISIHAVDVAEGRPAVGMEVENHHLDDDGVWRLSARGEIGANGAFDHPITRGEGVREGLYEVRLHVGRFLARRETPPPPFLELVPFRFRVFDLGQHYHLPIKFTPWGYSLYRGS
jgi:5-hydroxyisourate hydrolase